METSIIRIGFLPLGNYVISVRLTYDMNFLIKKISLIHNSIGKCIHYTRYPLIFNLITLNIGTHTRNKYVFGMIMIGTHTRIANEMVM